MADSTITREDFSICVGEAWSGLDADVDHTLLRRWQVSSILLSLGACFVGLGHDQRHSVQTGAMLDRSFGPRRLDQIRRFQQSDCIDRGGDRHGSGLLADEQTTESMIKQFRYCDQYEVFEAASPTRISTRSAAPLGKLDGSPRGRRRAAHNVLIERHDGNRVVRPSRGLRKVVEAQDGV